MDEEKFRNRLAGQVRFPEDISSRKMVHALIVKADRAPGIIREIIVPRLPAHIHFFRAEDIPGKNDLPYPDASIPLLARDEVLYRGQAVGLLTGPDPDELFKIRREISVSLSPIPLFPPKEMRDAGNCPAAKTIVKGNPSKGFTRSHRIIEGTFTFHIPETPVYPRPGVYCAKEGGTYVLNLHSQWPSLLRKLTALAAGISRKQVELHFNTAGRTWDAHIWQSIPSAALAVCATSILRQPVKIITEEEEVNNREILFRYSAGVDSKGKLTAMKAQILVDTGAFGAFSSEVVSRICLGASGLYLCRHMEVEVRGYRSNTPPWLPMASWGLAQGNFGMEVLANHLALDADQDPAQWRRQNLAVKGNLNSTQGLLKKTPPLSGMIKTLCISSDYNRRHSAYRQIRINKNPLAFPPSRYTGIGIAVTRQGYEFLSRDRLLTAASVTATLNKDGILDVFLGTVPATPGIVAIWKKSISKQLSIDEKMINLIYDRPDEHSFNGPSCLSRNAIVYTKLIDQCCAIIQKKRFREGLPITETKSYRRRTGAEWDEEKMTGTPFSSPSWAAAVVEVSLHTATKEISIPRIWLSIHSGQILDRSAARSYLEAETRFALTQCLDKQAIKPSVFPELHIFFEEEENSGIPGGMEGLVLGTLPSAFIQALSQASGRSVTALPVNSAALLKGAL